MVATDNASLGESSTKPSQTPEPNMAPFYTIPDANPAFTSRVDEVGLRFISKAMQNYVKTGDPERDFLKDQACWMEETKENHRLPTIGGGPLELFRFFKQILRMGGVQNVIDKREFKNVGRALGLPKSCTSAAFILRTSYEKLLYTYEQKFVWNRDPDKIPKVFNPNVRHLNTDNIIRGSTPSSGRPRRQAALAASNSLAMSLSDDPYATPYSYKRRRSSLDEESLTPHQRELVYEQLRQEQSPTATYRPTLAGERERVVAGLLSSIPEEIAWALGTLNVLSYDQRSGFNARAFPALDFAFKSIIEKHVMDVERRIPYSSLSTMDESPNGTPRVATMLVPDIEVNGRLSRERIAYSGLKGPRPLRFSEYYLTELFNCVDPTAVDREQFASVVVNIMRNMSFSPRNASYLAESGHLMRVSAEAVMNFKIPANIRDGLMDMWVNIAPYMSVASTSPAHIVLKTSIKLLDPFLDGANFNRFAHTGEILARLAASGKRNESAIVDVFGELLPRLTDMLGGRDSRYVNAGLAALCNCSAFDWTARSKIARSPRTLARLICLLSVPELAPRAALTLLNLSEAPSNRSVMLVYEKNLVIYTSQESPVAETVSNILFEIASD